jgi:hypothetical protein
MEEGNMNITEYKCCICEKIDVGTPDELEKMGWRIKIVRPTSGERTEYWCKDCIEYSRTHPVTFQHSFGGGD